MKIVYELSRWLDRICSFLITYLLVWMTVMMALEIAARAIFNSGITWSEEMARFSMVWMVFLGAAVATRAETHISVTALEEKFPGLKKWLKPIQNLLSFIYLIIVIWISWSVLPIVNTQTSANLQIPMSVMYISIPVSFIIMCIHFLVLFFKKQSRHNEGETVQ